MFLMSTFFYGILSPVMTCHTTSSLFTMIRTKTSYVRASSNHLPEYKIRVTHNPNLVLVPVPGSTRTVAREQGKDAGWLQNSQQVLVERL
jgi:hypothetical protein